MNRKFIQCHSRISTIRLCRNPSHCREAAQSRTCSQGAADTLKYWFLGQWISCIDIETLYSSSAPNQKKLRTAGRPVKLLANDNCVPLTGDIHLNNTPLNHHVYISTPLPLHSNPSHPGPHQAPPRPPNTAAPPPGARSLRRLRADAIAIFFPRPGSLEPPQRRREPAFDVRQVPKPRR
jgi:hypothetical protein